MGVARALAWILAACLAAGCAHPLDKDVWLRAPRLVTPSADRRWWAGTRPSYPPGAPYAAPAGCPPPSFSDFPNRVCRRGQCFPPVYAPHCWSSR